MANTSSIRGFQLVGRLGGGIPHVISMNLPAGDNTATFVGDPVKFAGDADSEGRPTIDQAGVGDAVCGVIVGFEPRAAALDAVHRPASTSVNARVCVDTSALYEVQCSTALTSADIGLNADSNAGAGGGSATSGASAYIIDAGTKATTATLVYKIIGLVNRPDNEFGSSQKVIVKINNHQYGSHTGTAGV